MGKNICNDRAGRDKVLHFGVSLLIALGVGAALHAIPAVTDNIGALGIALAAFVVTISVGLGKELRDASRPGNHFCVWDLLADVVGAVLGAVIIWFCCECLI